MKKPQPAPFEQQHMADCLRAQAHLCEQIAAQCWNEEKAKKFAAMAQDCKNAAEEETTVTPAVWPAAIS